MAQHRIFGIAMSDWQSEVLMVSCTGACSGHRAGGQGRHGLDPCEGAEQPWFEHDSSEWRHEAEESCVCNYLQRA